MLLCHNFRRFCSLFTLDDAYRASPARPLPHRIMFARPLPCRMTFARWSLIAQLTVTARRMAFSALAAFSSQARGIKFYYVPTGMIQVQVGDSLDCRLEPTNRYHSNCVALWLSWPSMMLAGEVACHLAPLLRCGFVTSG